MKTSSEADRATSAISQAEVPRIPRWLSTGAALSWRFVAVVAAGSLVVYGLVRLRLVLLPVVMALFLATLLAPPTGWLRARGWPRLLAAWTVLLGALLLVGGLIALLAPRVAAQVGEMGEALGQGSEEVLAWLAKGPLGISEAQVDTYVDRILGQIRENVHVIARGLLQGAVTAGEFVAGVLLTLVLTFFFVKEGDTMFAWLIDHLGRGPGHHAREIGVRAWSSLAAYVRGIGDRLRGCGADRHRTGAHRGASCDAPGGADLLRGLPAAHPGRCWRERWPPLSLS